MKKFIGRAIITLGIVFIIGIAFIWFFPNIIENTLCSKKEADLISYYQVKDGQAAIILDGKLMEDMALIKEDKIYLPYDLVKTSIDERFYWDGTGDLIVFTDALSIDQVSIKEGTDACLVNDVIYLSLAFIQTHIAIAEESFENPSRVFLNHQKTARYYTTIRKESHLRIINHFNGSIITSLSKGERIEIIHEGRLWDFVRSEDGNLGYVLRIMLNQGVTKEQAETKNLKESEYTSLSLGEDICLVWHQVGSKTGNNQLEKLLSSSESVNVVSPTWFAIYSDKGEYTSYAQASYVKTAHKKGIKVWALVDDFNQDMSIYRVLSKTSVRLKLVENLVQDVLSVGADGINVDFEYISEDSGKHFLEFLRELSARCRTEGLVLSVDNANPTYIKEQYHMEKQAEIVDYVMIMAYDEHWQGSNAGSTASLSYVETGIKNALTMVPANKLVNGIPFYTRVWKEVPEQYAQDGAEIWEDGNSEYTRYQLTSAAYSMDAVTKLLGKYNAKKSWNEELGQYYSEISLPHGKYRIWIEDAKSLEEKLKVVQNNSIAGIACWKLGLESSNVWPTITKYINNNES